MLGLRLDEPVPLGDATTSSLVDGVLDPQAIERLAGRGLVERADGGIRLTPRGRLLGDAVTAELLAWPIE